MIMEKSPLLDRDWSISVLQVLTADEITNYSITMMADEKTIRQLVHIPKYHII